MGERNGSLLLRLPLAIIIPYEMCGGGHVEESKSSYSRRQKLCCASSVDIPDLLLSYSPEQHGRHLLPRSD